MESPPLELESTPADTASQELVSIILPFFNGDQFIRPAIESVLHQTHREWELIVVDDGSPDETHSSALREFIGSLGNERVNYFWKENGGLSRARNFGVFRSKGEYVCFMDQDDLWKLDKLSIQLEVFRSHPTIELVTAEGYWLGEKSGTIGYGSRYGFGEGIVFDAYHRMLRANIVSCSAIMIKRSLLTSFPGSNPYFQVCPDYELFMRLLVDRNFFFIEKPLFEYRLHGGNTSKNFLRLYLEEIAILHSAPIKSYRAAAIIGIRTVRNFFRIFNISTSTTSF